MSETMVEQSKSAENGLPVAQKKPKAAYISAPSGMDVSGVRRILESKGVECFSPDELDLPDQNLLEIMRQGMERADLVVAVVDDTPASSFVYYELGFAQAQNKQTVVLLAADVPLSPWQSIGTPYFRFSPEEPSSLEFGLTQILQLPHHGSRPAASPSKRTHPIGPLADELLTQVRDAGDNLDEAELQAIIERAIRGSGVATVSPGGPHDKGADLAVWSDDLSPWVGNPLPIDLRIRLDAGKLRAVSAQLSRAIPAGGMSWGLIIHLRSCIDAATPPGVSNIIHISVEDFLTALRGTSFGDLIRRLRNQRVHGGC